MKILQLGVEKSGNYWLYSILHNILNFADVENLSYIQSQSIYQIAKDWELSFKDQAKIDVVDFELKCYFKISSIFRMPINNFDEYLNQATHVWSHSNYINAALPNLSKFDKVFYIIRDPRDVAISMSRFVFTPYMKKYYPSTYSSSDEYLRSCLMPYMKRWCDHVLGFLRISKVLNIHLIFYEHLIDNPTNELIRIIKYLNLDLKDSTISLILKNISFEQMKIENPMHVRKGRLYNWREVLNQKQINIVAERYGFFLRECNYPIYNDDEITLPENPNLARVDQHAKFQNRDRRLSIKERMLLIKRVLSF